MGYVFVQHDNEHGWWAWDNGDGSVKPVATPDVDQLTATVVELQHKLREANRQLGVLGEALTVAREGYDRAVLDLAVLKAGQRLNDMIADRVIDAHFDGNVHPEGMPK